LEITEQTVAKGDIDLSQDDLAAYNEEETIGKVINEIPREIEGVGSIETLVINDGSTDSSSNIAEKAGAKVFSHETNLGLGVTFRDGLKQALEMDADIIANIDADFQYNAKEIPKLIEPIIGKRVDIVLGDRQIDKLKHMPLSKKIGNKIPNKSFAILLFHLTASASHE